MKILDIFRLAFKNFLRRRMRSILTIIGVSIGAMSVIVMISIGIGMNESIEQSVSQWGSLTEVNVYPNYDTSTSLGKINDLSLPSIESIEHVTSLFPYKYENFILVNGKETANISVIAIDLSRVSETNFKLFDGRQLSSTDTNAVLLGYDTLFRFSNPKNNEWVWNPSTDDEGNPLPLPFNPVGEQLKMTFDYSYGMPGPKPTGKKPKLNSLDCVGIISLDDYQFSYNVVMDLDTLTKYKEAYEKEQAKSGNDYYDPYASSGGTKIKEENTNKFDNLIINVDKMDNVVLVMNSLKEMGYDCYSMTESLDYMKKQTQLLQFILLAIGIMAFFVAVIGIINTMLMSMYERTREIGIMKVMGCKLSNICSLFLSESVIIGVFGGSLGVGISYLASMLLNKIARDGDLSIIGYTGSMYDVSVIHNYLIIVGILVSIGVSFIAGLYPSIKASRISSLEAIKNE